MLTVDSVLFRPGCDWTLCTMLMWFFLWCVYWTPVDESCDNRSSRWCLTTPRWLCVCVCVCLRFEPVNSKHRLCLHTLWTPNGVCRVLLQTVFVFIFLQLWCGCWHSFPSLPAVSEEIWNSAPSQAFPLLGVMEFGRERLPDQKVGQTVGIVFMAWFSEAGGG